ncbi:MAG: ABC transporter ATP-binding protein [Desulfitobacteriaceae bacterium]
MAFLQIKNLSFTYPNASHKALDNVCLNIAEGELVLICGVSGCGKSTLLWHLKRDIAPHGRRSGVIYYAGKLMEELTCETVAEEIGFVMQNPETQIVTDMVWHELAFGLENLGLDTQEIRRKVAEMASFFGINGWFRKPVTELSGGQKQLLNLASVMAMQPRVLLLDEPTAQLDPIAAQEFLDIIAKINRDLGVTVILSEHRLEEAFPMADQVVVMDKGRILQAGKPAEIVLMLEREGGHVMYKGLPSSVRIYGAIKKGNNCPLTVREGRNWLNELLSLGAGNMAGELKRGSEGKPAEEQKSHQKTVRKRVVAEEQGRPAVEVKQVWFRYEKNGGDILRGLSLQAYPGHVLGVLGGNGAGKSTLLGVIAGLLKPYRGQVIINGRKITEFKAGELYRNNLVFLPQNPKALFVQDTVREELVEAASLLNPDQEVITGEIAEIAAELSIEDLLLRHPYDLSGGEQQKAALAKLLLLKPRVILLDEPTKGLDAYSKEVLAQIFAGLCTKGVAIVMVSHDLEFAAEYADTCAMIFDGDIVSAGTAGEFFVGNSFYTTAANRMARGLFPQAVTCKDVIKLCQMNLNTRKAHS